MDGDNFTDPRRRSSRRPAGSRGRGRGRGQPHSRGAAKRVGHGNRKRAEENLGSNEYRFRERVPEEEDAHEYEQGVDFEEAASAQVYDPNANIDSLRNDDVLSELVADFSRLEGVLQTVPLWVRLGEHTRFALGVADDDVIENYLDPLPESEPEVARDTKRTKDYVQTLLDDVAKLSFDYGGDHNTTSPAAAETSSAKGSDPGKDEEVTQKATATDEADDFDRWLDEV